jgi:outer membrane receptor protein involved in Fe transport
MADRAFELFAPRRLAGIVDLNPALRFSDPSTARVGNSDLRPEITDAYEGKLSLGISSHKLDLTLFVRRTKDPFSQTSALTSDGVLLTSEVNLGSVVSRGASLSARGPIGGGFRYSLNADAADRKFTLGAVTAAAAAAGGLQYGGSAQIEYRDGAEGRRGADHVTLDLRYRGPTNVVLYQASSYFTATTSWSHGFTDRLSGVLKIDDLAGARHYATTYFSADSVSRQTYRTPGRRVTLSLIRTLGPAPRPTP